MSISTLHPFYLLFLAFVLSMSSCSLLDEESGDFYSYNKDGDLWRVPLLEPYEVVSPTNSDQNDWFLILASADIEGTDFFSEGDEFQLSKLHRVGSLDSTILIESKRTYWPKLGDDYPTQLILDARSGRCFIYALPDQQQAFAAKKRELGIESIEMHDWQALKDRFIDSLILPQGWKP